MDCEPLTALAPDQAPEAVQAEAFVDDHVRVAPLPLVTVLGLAMSATVGAGGVTDTVIDWLALPPDPVQVSIYVEVALIAPVVADPLKPRAPAHAPEAMHEVALDADHVKVEAWPLATVLGFALKEMVAVGCGVTVTVVA